MRFRLHVANRDTGKERDMVIDAIDEAEAIRLAGQQNVLINRVEEISRNTGAPPPHAVTPAEPDVPTYPALSLVAVFLTAFAIVGYAIGAIALTAAIAFAINKRENTDPFLVGLYGLSSFVSSLMLHGFAQLLYAIRDIAINSFERSPA